LEQIQKMKMMIEMLIQKGAHDEREGPGRIDLNGLLEEELSLLNHNLFFKHQVVVKKNFVSPLPPLHAYYIDVSQGLLNVIRNAIEAMEESTPKELTVITQRQRHQVEVQIRDTGYGFSEEVRSNLFKPFFTTKGSDHFGLGLFISKRILAPYGASFRYDCGGGETTFRVDFPI
jgi:signal transduction histidine kinase